MAGGDYPHVCAKLLLDVDDHLVRLAVVGHCDAHDGCQWEIAPQLISFQNVDSLLSDDKVPRVSEAILAILDDLTTRNENLVTDVRLNLGSHIQY